MDRYYMRVCMEKYERGSLEQQHVELMCNALEESLLSCLDNNGAYTNVKDRHSLVYTPMQLFLCDAAYILCRLLCVPPMKTITFTNNEEIHKDSDEKAIASYVVMRDPVARTLGGCFAKVLMHSLISVTNTSSPNFDAFNAITTGLNKFVESYSVLLLQSLSDNVNSSNHQIHLEFVMQADGNICNRPASDGGWKHGNVSAHEVFDNACGPRTYGHLHVINLFLSSVFETVISLCTNGEQIGRANSFYSGMVAVGLDRQSAMYELYSSRMVALKQSILQQCVRYFVSLSSFHVEYDVPASVMAVYDNIFGIICVDMGYNRNFDMESGVALLEPSSSMNLCGSGTGYLLSSHDMHNIVRSSFEWWFLAIHHVADRNLSAGAEGFISTKSTQKLVSLSKSNVSKLMHVVIPHLLGILKHQCIPCGEYNSSYSCETMCMELIVSQAGRIICYILKGLFSNGEQKCGSLSSDDVHFLSELVVNYLNVLAIISSAICSSHEEETSLELSCVYIALRDVCWKINDDWMTQSCLSESYSRVMPCVYHLIQSILIKVLEVDSSCPGAPDFCTDIVKAVFTDMCSAGSTLEIDGGCGDGADNQTRIRDILEKYIPNEDVLCASSTARFPARNSNCPLVVLIFSAYERNFPNVFKSSVVHDNNKVASVVENLKELCCFEMVFKLMELKFRGHSSAVFDLIQSHFFCKLYVTDRLIASVGMCLDMLDTSEQGGKIAGHRNCAGIDNSVKSLAVMGLVVGSFYRSLSILHSMITHAVSRQKDHIPNSYSSAWYKKIIQLIYVYLEKYCSKYCVKVDSAGVHSVESVQVLCYDVDIDTFSTMLYNLQREMSSKYALQVSSLRIALGACVSLIDSIDLFVAQSGVVSIVSTFGCVASSSLLYSSTGQKHLSIFKYLVCHLNVGRSLKLVEMLVKACAESNSYPFILTVLQRVWESITETSSYGVDCLSIVGHYVAHDMSVGTLDHPVLEANEGVHLSLDIVYTCSCVVDVLNTVLYRVISDSPCHSGKSRCGASIGDVLKKLLEQVGACGGGVSNALSCYSGTTSLSHTFSKLSKMSIDSRNMLYNVIEIEHCGRQVRKWRECASEGATSSLDMSNERIKQPLNLGTLVDVSTLEALCAVTNKWCVFRKLIESSLAVFKHNNDSSFDGFEGNINQQPLNLAHKLLIDLLLKFATIALMIPLVIDLATLPARDRDRSMAKMLRANAQNIVVDIEFFLTNPVFALSSRNTCRALHSMFLLGKCTGNPLFDAADSYGDDVGESKQCGLLLRRMHSYSEGLGCIKSLNNIVKEKCLLSTSPSQSGLLRLAVLEKEQAKYLDVFAAIGYSYYDVIVYSFRCGNVSFSIHSLSVFTEFLLGASGGVAGPIDGNDSAGFYMLTSILLKLARPCSRNLDVTGNQVNVLLKLFEASPMEFVSVILKPILRCTHSSSDTGSLHVSDQYKLLYDYYIPLMFGSVDASVPFIGYLLFADVLLTYDKVAYAALEQYQLHIQSTEVSDTFRLSSIVDDTPLVLYHLLSSDKIQEELDERRILEGDFYDILCRIKNSVNAGAVANYDEALRVTRYSAIRDDSASNTRSNKVSPFEADFPCEGALQKLMLLFVWDLGSHVLRQERAIRSLRILCTFMVAKSWKVSIDGARHRKAASKGVSVGGDLDQHVCAVLAENFLYIMSKLIQNDWNSSINSGSSGAGKSVEQQEQSVRVLTVLTKLLLPDNGHGRSNISQDTYGFVKYLPKIMFVIDLALSSSVSYRVTNSVEQSKSSHDCYRVQYSTIVLLLELCNRLPASALLENIPCIVISLCPIIQSGLKFDSEVTNLRKGLYRNSMQFASTVLPLFFSPHPLAADLVSMDAVVRYAHEPKYVHGGLSVTDCCAAIAKSVNTTLNMFTMTHKSSGIYNICKFFVSSLESSVFHGDLSLEYQYQSKTLAIDLLNYLFVQRKMEFVPALKYIPFFPTSKDKDSVRGEPRGVSPPYSSCGNLNMSLDSQEAVDLSLEMSCGAEVTYPSLEEAKSLHKQQLKYVSPESSLSYMITLLSHEFVQVRIAAIQRITAIWQQHRKYLYDQLLLQSSSDNSSNMYALASGSNANSPINGANGTVVPPALSVASVISSLMRELLQLSGRESNATLRDACARCFGEIGAIDPARLDPTVLSQPVVLSIEGVRNGNITKAPSSTGSILAPSFGVPISQGVIDSTIRPPWSVTECEFGYSMLESHLIPAFKTTTTSSSTNDSGKNNTIVIQDRVGFAIQETLKIICKLYSAAFGEPPLENFATPLPEYLRTELSERGILDATEPFWHTSYSMKEVGDIRMKASNKHALLSAHDEKCTSSSKSQSSQFVRPNSSDRYVPIAMKVHSSDKLRYNVNCEGISGSSTTTIAYEKWISAWCRHLILNCGYASSGNMCPLSDYFVACRGAIKTSAELCVYLLPYIVFNLLIGSEKSFEPGDSGTVADMVMEIKYVLGIEDYGNISTKSKTTEFSSSLGARFLNQRMVQMVFKLFDTLESWFKDALTVQRAMEQQMVQQHKHQTEPLVTESIVKASVRLKNQYSDARVRIKSFLCAIPLSCLASAATRIQSFARALRYHELDSREHHRCKQGVVDAAADLQLQNGIATISKYMCIRIDGANGQLPVLPSQTLDELMRIFANIETDEAISADSIHGCVVLRHLYGYAIDSHHRILEYESNEDWMNCLMEYGMLSVEDAEYDCDVIGNVNQLQGVSASLMETPRSKRRKGDANISGSSCSDIGKQLSSFRCSPVGLINNSGRSCEFSDDQTRNRLLSLLALDRGRLKCLVELEQLQSVIDETRGITLRMMLKCGGAGKKRNRSNGDADSYAITVRDNLLPLGVEAAWKLHQWDTLDEFLDSTVADGQENSGINCRNNCSTINENDLPLLLGGLMSSLHAGNDHKFQHYVNEARQVVMASLSATSHESYKRSYSSLMQLHILRELEYGYSVLHGDRQHIQDTPGVKCSEQAVESAGDRVLSCGCLWSERLAITATSRKQRSSLLAIRRNVFAMCGRRDLVAGIWFDICTSYMQSSGSGISESSIEGVNSAVTQYHECARMALRNAQRWGMNQEAVLLQESHLLKDMNRVTEGLMLLEPVEMDISAIRSLFKKYNTHMNDKTGSSRPVTLPIGLQTPEERLQYSNKLLLSTKWMVGARQKHGRPVMDRFKLITEFNPKTADGFFEYAKYLEYLFNDARDKEDKIVGSAGGGSVAYEDIHDLSPQYAILTIELYGKCVQFGSHDVPAFGDQTRLESQQQSSQHILLQAMPRMLTFWLSFTGQKDEVSAGTKDERGVDIHTPTLKWIEKANGRVSRVVNLVSPSAWYSSMTQLVSRCADRHAHPKTLDIITQILIIVVQEFPQASIWHIAGLFHSLNQDRRAVGSIILNEVKAVLARKLQDVKIAKGTSSGQLGLEQYFKNMAAMIHNAPTLFQSFVELAQLQPKDPSGNNHPVKMFNWKVDKSLASTTLLSQFLVPLQSCLAVSNIRGHPINANAISIGGVSGTKDVVDTGFYSVAGEYIHSFVERVEVAVSKAKPKTFTVLTTSGKYIKFLCKQEKNGDLRMDARMMEFNGVVNRILACDAESRKRNLKLKTFSVICLSEECGILEWINNTNCLRHLINASHTYCAPPHANVSVDENSREYYPNIQTNKQEFYQGFIANQQKYETDLEALVTKYKETVLNKYQPCFHRWFIEKFHADPTSWLEARSLFTRSTALWNIVGFIVGLGDRHTENILVDVTSGECIHVDFDCLFDKGLGLKRPEIVPFRLTPNIVDAMGLTGLEGTYRRTMELSMKTLRDNKDMLLSVLEPFLRDPTVAWGRNGKAQQKGVRGGGAVGAGLGAPNAGAVAALATITSRLNGVYNIIHPSQDKIVKAYAARRQMPPSRGLGALKEEALPLSVPGQIQRLIDEAICVYNLAQMYIGWQPWN